MSDRRSFLSNLIAMGSLAIVPEKPVITPVNKDVLRYKGFTLRWTGWKTISNQNTLVGQWVAEMHRPGRGYYSSYPGGEGQYFPLMVFDLSVKNTQVPVTNVNSEEEKEEFRLECLTRVMKLIDDDHA